MTASNENQAEAFRTQIDYRLSDGNLPKKTKYIVLSDPDNKRVGSGGATLNVIRYLKKISGKKDAFKNKKILVIHSGGDSKRVPQYSACGKLFSSVPHEINGNRSATLFDEILITLSVIPSRINEGMMIFSGDILVLFNSLQLNSDFGSVAVLSAKEDVETGKNHGVFLDNKQGFVKNFLHKCSPEKLRSYGAVDNDNCVNIDTGIVLFGVDAINSLASLTEVNGEYNEDLFKDFVNEKVRLNFYGDFVYPLAECSTLEEFFTEKAENGFSEELKKCREKIWEALGKYVMKIIFLEPADFIHFGTTSELVNLYAKNIVNYKFLGWNHSVNTNLKTDKYTVITSYIDKDAHISDCCFIENSYIGKNVKIGNNCVISNVKLENISVEDNSVVHGLKLRDKGYVVRKYSVYDNPKDVSEHGKSLWLDEKFPVCETLDEAVNATLKGKNTNIQKMTSLCSGYEMADVSSILSWQSYLSSLVLANKIIEKIKSKTQTDKILESIPVNSTDNDAVKYLIEEAEKSELPIKMRIYNFLSHLKGGEKYTILPLRCLQKEFVNNLRNDKNYVKKAKIQKDKIVCESALRVNWGGGWSDAPPYCTEHGGTVINAAVKIGGIRPVSVTVERTKNKEIIFVCSDDNVSKKIETTEEIFDCEGSSDMFSLHKAVLIVLGIIPFGEKRSLDKIIDDIGGGFCLSTNAVNIPRGSGLGTSSILSATAIRALSQFFSIEIPTEEIVKDVLCVEQVMFTGGGWQDQIGGIEDGIKFITSKPGIDQNIAFERLDINESTKNELDERFCIVFSGQRRLARNILRDIVDAYLSETPSTVEVLDEIKIISYKMKLALENGDVDLFAKLLDENWKQYIKMYPLHSNACIEEILALCEDMICGRMVCGAGGGGFLQIILKKDFTAKDLSQRLLSVFGNSEIKVYNCELIY